MKTAGVVLLLLWSGQVVIAAHNQDVQTTNTGKDATQQSDIHTVLREMSVLITEQGVELKCTKTQLEAVQKKAEDMEKKAEAMETRLRASEKTVAEQSVELTHTKTQLETVEKKAEAMEKKAEDMEKKAEAMDSRLRDSENTTEAMESRLRACEKTVEEQGVKLTHSKTQLEAVEKKAEYLESLVNQLKTENKAQSADLNVSLAAVSDLERERDQSKVSFSAILLGEGGKEHSGVDTLVFRVPITNIGNAYNHQEGKFRAPIRGVYWFAVYIYGHGRQNHPVSVSLRKNGEHVAIASTYQTSGGINASNGASLLLEKGDEVWVKLWPGAWVYDNFNNHTTFSGHLLFAM